MGSYLTIVNDTNDPWSCKVGADLRAIKWAMISAAVIAGVALLITGAGLAAPALIGVVLGGGPAIFGVPILAMAGIAVTAGTAAAVAGGGTVVGLAVAQSVLSNLKKKNFDVLEKGEHKRYGKMSLSLWRQADCIRVTISGTSVIMESMSMRPIFSGSKDGSNRNHSIRYWLMHSTLKKEVIEANSGPPPKEVSPPKPDNNSSPNSDLAE